MAAMSRSTVEKQVCSECGNPRLVRDYNRAALVCSECGFVVEERICDPGPEWRNFGDGWTKNRSRTGPPRAETIHDYGLSTERATQTKWERVLVHA